MEPVRPVAASSGRKGTAHMAMQDAVTNRLQRALIVEDSMIIAMEAEDCLRELGVVEVEVTGSVEDAIAAINGADFELAILDYNLGEETSDAVANRLAERRIPFAVATGYGDLDSHFEQLGAMSILNKPYSKADLRGLVETVAGQKAA